VKANPRQISVHTQVMVTLFIFINRSNNYGIYVS